MTANENLIKAMSHITSTLEIAIELKKKEVVAARPVAPQVKKSSAEDILLAAEGLSEKDTKLLT